VAHCSGVHCVTSESMARVFYLSEKIIYKRVDAVNNKLLVIIFEEFLVTLYCKVCMLRCNYTFKF